MYLNICLNNALKKCNNFSFLHTSFGVIYFKFVLRYCYTTPLLFNFGLHMKFFLVLFSSSNFECTRAWFLNWRDYSLLLGINSCIHVPSLLNRRVIKWFYYYIAEWIKTTIREVMEFLDIDICIFMLTWLVN